ncbi:MAG: ABC transporter substrate binding protein, partial [Candidatus Binatia bacterium]
PEPTRRPRRTPRAAAAAKASPAPSTRVPAAEPDPARLKPTPSAPLPIVPTPTGATPIVPTPTGATPIIPTPTRPLPVIPTPTRAATAAESAQRILILQSDSGVPIYRDAAARLTSKLSGRVELRDLHGDRQQAIEALRESGADLVIAVGAVAATAAKQEISNRPVVFCAVLNPERYKLRAPNVAGVSFEVSAADQLARIHDALPTATRIGVIYDPEKTGQLVAAAEQAAPHLGLAIVKAAARDPREVDAVFRGLKRDIDVLWVIPDSTVVTRESFELLALHAAESRLPFVAFSESFARQGALLAFYPDAASVGEQCAALAARVLAGEVPSAIGVQAPARTMVAVNRRIEDQLGIRIGARLKPDVEIR